MGAKTALLVFTDGNPSELLRDAPEPDPHSTAALVKRTNPGWDGSITADGSLSEGSYPSEGTVYAGCFPGIDILCDRQVMIERPSELGDRFLSAGNKQTVILHGMHSVTDWFAYAIWENGTLIRSLSLAPDSGIMEDIGTPLPFEEPYWAGEHPVTPTPGWPEEDPYAFPFHPLELGGEAALRALLGFVVEGRQLASDIDADAIRLTGFKVPVSDPISQADIQEFMRTHTLTRYTYGPDGTLIPIEG